MEGWERGFLGSSFFLFFWQLVSDLKGKGVASQLRKQERRNE